MANNKGSEDFLLSSSPLPSSTSTKVHEGSTNHINEYSGYEPPPGVTHLVDRVNVKDITPEQFFSEYVIPRRPVAFSGHLTDPGWGGHKWTNQYLRENAGKSKVLVEKRSGKGSTKGTFGVKEDMVYNRFLDELEQGNEDLYMTTQDLERYGDDLDDFGMPQSVAGEPLCSLYKDFPLRPGLVGNLVPYQVSLWQGISRDGASSGLHHDFHDNLYMLVRGHKRFRLFPPSAARVLRTTGTITKIHRNGLIVYEFREGCRTVNIRADGVPLAFIARRKREDAEVDLADAEDDLLCLDGDSSTKGRSEEGIRLRKIIQECEDLIDEAIAETVRYGDVSDDDEVISISDSNDDEDEDEPVAKQARLDECVGRSKIEARSEMESNFCSVELPGSTNERELELYLAKLYEEAVSAAGENSQKEDITEPADSSQNTAETVDSSSCNCVSSTKQGKKRKVLPELPAMLGCLVIDLKPGEMLYIPASWFHEVTSCSYKPSVNDKTYVVDNGSQIENVDQLAGVETKENKQLTEAGTNSAVNTEARTEVIQSGNRSALVNDASGRSVSVIPDSGKATDASIALVSVENGPENILKSIPIDNRHIEGKGDAQVTNRDKDTDMWLNPESNEAADKVDGVQNDVVNSGVGLTDAALSKIDGEQINAFNSGATNVNKVGGERTSTFNSHVAIEAVDKVGEGHTDSLKSGTTNEAVAQIDGAQGTDALNSGVTHGAAAKTDRGHLALNYWIYPPDADNFKQPYIGDFWPHRWHELSTLRLLIRHQRTEGGAPRNGLSSNDVIDLDDSDENGDEDECYETKELEDSSSPVQEYGQERMQEFDRERMGCNEALMVDDTSSLCEIIDDDDDESDEEVISSMTDAGLDAGTMFNVDARLNASDTSGTFHVDAGDVNATFDVDAGCEVSDAGATFDVDAVGSSSGSPMYLRDTEPGSRLGENYGSEPDSACLVADQGANSSLNLLSPSMRSGNFGAAVREIGVGSNEIRVRSNQVRLNGYASSLMEVDLEVAESSSSEADPLSLVNPLSTVDPLNAVDLLNTVDMLNEANLLNAVNPFSAVDPLNAVDLLNEVDPVNLLTEPSEIGKMRRVVEEQRDVEMLDDGDSGGVDVNDDILNDNFETGVVTDSVTVKVTTGVKD